MDVSKTIESAEARANRTGFTSFLMKFYKLSYEEFVKLEDSKKLHIQKAFEKQTRHNKAQNMQGQNKRRR